MKNNVSQNHCKTQESRPSNSEGQRAEVQKLWEDPLIQAVPSSCRQQVQPGRSLKRKDPVLPKISGFGEEVSIKLLGIGWAGVPKKCLRLTIPH